MQRDALRGTPLGQLCLCLSLDEQTNDDLERAITDRQLDWPQLLHAASQHLITPSLTSVLQRRRMLDRLDQEVRDYLEGIRSLNLIRNEILQGELINIAKGLNGIGITPLLIKGAAALLPDQYPGAFDRMMGDLDIVVPDERMKDAHAQLARLGYKDHPDAWPWTTAAESRSNLHIPSLQHHALPVSVELHRRIVCDPADDLALRNGGKLQALVLPDGTKVLVQDPSSRLVQSYVHSQVSHRLGIHRIVNLRHLYEFACLSQFNRSDLAQQSVFGCAQPRRRAALAEYWAIAEAWLGAFRPEDIPRSPRDVRAMQLTERVMTDSNWRKAFAIWAELASLPRRLVAFGLRIWEMPDYLPIRIRRFWAGR